MDERRAAYGGLIKVLAGHGGPDDRKDARADHRTYAERGQRPWAKSLLEPVRRFLRLADELVDRLAGKQLAEQ